MMTLGQKAVALIVIAAMNVIVGALAWWFLLFSLPASIPLALAILRR